MVTSSATERAKGSQERGGSRGDLSQGGETDMPGSRESLRVSMKCSLGKRGKKTFPLCMIPHCRIQPQLGDNYNNFPTVRKSCRSQREETN